MYTWTYTTHIISRNVNMYKMKKNSIIKNIYNMLHILAPFWRSTIYINILCVPDVKLWRSDRIKFNLTLHFLMCVTLVYLCHFFKLQFSQQLKDSSKTFSLNNKSTNLTTWTWVHTLVFKLCLCMINLILFFLIYITRMMLVK